MWYEIETVGTSNLILGPAIFVLFRPVIDVGARCVPKGLTPFYKCVECDHLLVGDEVEYLYKGKSCCDDCYRAVKKSVTQDST